MLQAHAPHLAQDQEPSHAGREAGGEGGLGDLMSDDYKIYVDAGHLRPSITVRAS